MGVPSKEDLKLSAFQGGFKAAKAFPEEESFCLIRG
jgi:hypothetical protein